MSSPPRERPLASGSRPWPGRSATCSPTRWVKTAATYDRENPKQVYYLSMEFLIGRSTSNNLLNLLVEPFVREEMRRQGLDPDRLDEEEPDAGLGNGGLGRLAACFVELDGHPGDPGDRVWPSLRIRDLPSEAVKKPD